MIPGLSHWDLLEVEKPLRYIGGEVNQAAPKPGASLRVCLAFPDVYELGMSNIALKILYEILDGDPRIAVERVFSPWVDFEDLLRRKDLPLFSLETRTPLNSFDILGITLPYEMTLTNVLNLLELGKIALDRDERQEGPIVMGGGPSGANPVPIGRFFDAVLVGDGEEALPEACSVVLAGKRSGHVREDILREISKIEGFWVPRFPGPVRRRVFKGFSGSVPPLRPVVPNIQTVHNRVPIEIFRGCLQGCRFCNAGFFYRPKRERPAEKIAEWSRRILAETGDETLGLVSLSTSDYSRLPELLAMLDSGRRSADQTVSVPSLRMDDKTLALLQSTPNLKKGGLTFAPEAGSQRLRDIIGKRITEDEILRVILATKDSAYRTVKLYFMIGLPFETDSDIAAIPTLIRKMEEVCRRGKIHKEFSISLSGFVPKPFTPFQWAGQDEFGVLREKRVRICEDLKKSRARISWRDEFLCRLEAVLARGDARIGELLVAARRRNCRFDGWGDHFQASEWRESFVETGIDFVDYTKSRTVSEVLPWDFIDFRVPRAFLEKEYRAAASLAGVQVD